MYIFPSSCHMVQYPDETCPIEKGIATHKPEYNNPSPLKMKPALQKKGLRPNTQTTFFASFLFHDETCPIEKGIATICKCFNCVYAFYLMKPALQKKGLRLFYFFFLHVKKFLQMKPALQKKGLRRSKSFSSSIENPMSLMKPALQKKGLRL